jgi:lipopolysaccharide/colanic/teichoic acid biosynthesis glycosyltransferase
MDITTTPRISYYALFKARFSDILKRALDIFASSLALILLSPFFALIAYQIKRDSPGPVFYRGPRIGLGGKVFLILKFRTMYERPQSYAGPRVTAHDDDRITPLGRWLRDTKLNELPQFWNVLKGDMSLVGPRPEDPELAKGWSPEVWHEVLSVRPGVTSPASVHYSDEEALLSSGDVVGTYMEKLVPDKIRLDQLYVRNRSFLLDLDTLLWTFLILLPMIGSQTPPEQLVFVGPFTRLVRRYINWFVIDSLVTFAAFAAAGIIWRSTEPLNVGWTKSLIAATAFSFLFSTINATLKVNQISWAKAKFADIYDLLPAWLISSVLAILVNLTLKIWPTIMVMTACGFALLGYIFLRYRSRLLGAAMRQMTYHWAGEQVGRERVLVVGAGSAGQHAAWLMDHPSNAKKYWMVGFVDDDMYKQDMRLYGVKVIGKIQELPELIERYDVGVVILAQHHRNPISCHKVVNLCKQTHVRLVILPDILSYFNELVGPSPAPMIPVTADDDGIENEMHCMECMTQYAISPRELFKDKSNEAK